MNKILLIGCGHMGSALLNAWTFKTNYSYLVVDPVNYKKINNKYGKKVISYKNIKEINNFRNVDIVIFAVKPQIINNVLYKFNEFKFNKKTIFISIVAGKKINFFENFLPTSSQFIRVMPNLPAMVNAGMTCLISNTAVTKKNKKIINLLFETVGETLWLNKESDINKVTAISGSGPGYVFQFIDAFEKAASKLGLGEKVNRKLIYQTFFGSINLLLKENKTASLLAKNIAIKGGTTEAGLQVFNDKKILQKTFNKVIKAAYMKANKLGN